MPSNKELRQIRKLDRAQKSTEKRKARRDRQREAAANREAAALQAGSDSGNGGGAIDSDTAEVIQESPSTVTIPSRPVPALTPPQRSGDGKKVASAKAGGDGARAKASPAGDGNFFVIEVDPARVRPTKKQVRGSINQTKLDELAESIRTEGQNEPGQVFAIEGDPDHDWQVLKGHRRRLACIQAGCLFKAVVKAEPGSLEARLTEMVLSNKFREDLVPIEEAELAGQYDKLGLGHQRIAQKLGLKEPMVAKRLALLKLIPKIQAMMAAEVDDKERLGSGVAYEVSKLPKPQQIELVKLVKVRGLTITQVERFVRDKLAQRVPGGYQPPSPSKKSPKATIGKPRPGRRYQESPPSRKRVASDDRSVFDDRINRMADHAAEFGEFSQDTFDLMFAPRSDVDYQQSLYNAQRVRDNMAVVIEKLEKANPHKGK